MTRMGHGKQDRTTGNNKYKGHEVGINLEGPRHKQVGRGAMWYEMKWEIVKGAELVELHWP